MGIRTGFIERFTNHIKNDDLNELEKRLESYETGHPSRTLTIKETIEVQIIVMKVREIQMGLRP